MNKLFLTSVLFIVSPFVLLAQDVYFIGFANKIGTNYTISNPNEFLSQRSINRRNRQGIGITQSDLPVSHSYINEVASKGALIRYPLKWMNGVVATIPTESVLQEVTQLSFVTSTIKIFDSNAKGSMLPDDEFGPVFSEKRDPLDFYNYGSSATQIKMMNGHKLHNLGYRGQGMLITVLDAGFRNVNVLSAFSNLWFNNRIVFMRDYVNRNSNIFNEHSHGTIVLSAMAGNISGQLVGTAPEASYILIRTEDANSEQIIEEYNWAAGIELADSLGADVVNSSLGYYLFDVESQNHSYSHMDGQTTPSARMANEAMSKGLLVIASAGNEGGTQWQRIITPSDAFGSIAVGAVDSQGNYASFSSIGPSFDGRVKPDVSAMGKATVVQNSMGNIATANGTSLSAPLVAGLATCLWQKYSNLTATEIKQLILQAGSIYNNPNPNLGHGIPNFGIYTTGLIDTSDTFHKVRLFPNPTDSTISFVTPNLLMNKELTIRVFGVSGNLEFQSSIVASSTVTQINLPMSMARGVYLVFVYSGNYSSVGKFVKGLK